MKRTTNFSVLIIACLIIIVFISGCESISNVTQPMKDSISNVTGSSDEPMKDSISNVTGSSDEPMKDSISNIPNSSEKPMKDFYTKDDFQSLTIGQSTFKDVYAIAPVEAILAMSYGGFCEYPMQNGGCVRIKFYGAELVVKSIDEVACSDTSVIVYKNILDLASKIYEESELLQIIGFDGSMDDLNTQYPIECLREDSGVYRVSYLGNDKIAVLLFDESGNKILGRIHSFKQLKANFSELAEGQSLEEVMEIDPDGEYLFLYTGRNDVPRESSHYTKDGYLITIEYDDSNNIISIKEKLI